MPGFQFQAAVLLAQLERLFDAGELAVKGGRKARTKLKLGICGEHGGDPESIEWCHMIGNNYVSCSPFRVPIARLAAGGQVIRRRLAVVR